MSQTGTFSLQIAVLKLAALVLSKSQVLEIQVQLLINVIHKTQWIRYSRFLGS